MKKISIVAVAIALSFAFSAFLPKTGTIDLYYESSPNVFTPIPPEVEPCPSGNRTQCEVEIDGQLKSLWLDDQGKTPYMRD